MKRLSNIWKSARTYIDIFGVTGLWQITYCIFSNKKKLAQAHSRWASFPIFVRLNSSDISAFRQVFIEREYEIVHVMPSLQGAVIDGGANIGLTSVFLADRHPDAEIIAIEPDEANFRILQRNVAGFERIRCIRGALWSQDGTVRIDSADAKEWAIRVKAADAAAGEEVQAMRLSTVFQQTGRERIALLKLDIEGAEYEVFQDANGWIGAVDNIVIELHESLRPGCTALFMRATSDFDVVAEGRELTFVSRRSP